MPAGRLTPHTITRNPIGYDTPSYQAFLVPHPAASHLHCSASGGVSCVDQRRLSVHNSEGSYLHSQQRKPLCYTSLSLSQLRVVVLHVHVTPPLRRGTPVELSDKGLERERGWWRHLDLHHMALSLPCFLEDGFENSTPDRVGFVVAEAVVVAF